MCEWYEVQYKWCLFDVIDFKNNTRTLPSMSKFNTFYESIILFLCILCSSLKCLINCPQKLSYKCVKCVYPIRILRFPESNTEGKMPCKIIGTSPPS